MPEFLASTTAIVTSASSDLQIAIVTILTAVIVIGVGLLAFYFGWRKARGMVR